MKDFMYVLAAIMHLTLSPVEEPKIICGNTDLMCAHEEVNLYVLGESGHSIGALIEMLEHLLIDDAIKSNLLGIIYLNSKDNKLIDKAERLFKAASDTGLKSADHNLAELFFYKGDYASAHKYLIKIAGYNYEPPDIRYINWARLYAQILYSSKDPSIRDVEMAMMYFDQIKDLDHSGVSYYVIGHHMINSGAVDNGITALNKSSSLKNDSAIMLLADIYVQGEIVEQDMSKAQDYYEVAASMGNGRAFYNLAIISHSQGDISRMKDYLIKASKAGDKDAAVLIERLIESTAKNE